MKIKDLQLLIPGWSAIYAARELAAMKMEEDETRGYCGNLQEDLMRLADYGNNCGKAESRGDFKNARLWKRKTDKLALQISQETDRLILEKI